MTNLFETEEYKRDKTKFFFVERNRKLASAKVYTDNQTYVACQGDTNLPVWVWTLENLSLNNLKDLKEVLTNYLDNCEVHVTSRREVYDYLVNTNYQYLEQSSYFEMGFLECNKVLEPTKCEGYLDKARLDEVDLLSEYVYLDREELQLDVLTRKEAYNKAVDLLNDDNFYVWRNNNGKLVAYLNYYVVDNQAKLGNVYTVKEERRKGYCANLVYNVTKNLLEQGYTPFLYTDYNYPNSNGAYKKVGYEDLGYLVNYTLKKK